jgi:putative aminopeptidase FrvX
MFMGWYDPDRKFPPERKLAEAIARYTEKFGLPPQKCITSAADAEELTKAGVDFPVEAKTFISRYTYYVGEDDPESVVQALR